MRKQEMRKWHGDRFVIFEKAANKVASCLRSIGQKHGKKTLLKTIYAVSLQIISRKYDLPLPNFLIIDTPMKNIGKLDKSIFENFYQTLFKLSKNELKDTQIILIEKEFIKPDIEGIYIEYEEIKKLIDYYDGP